MDLSRVKKNADDANDIGIQDVWFIGHYQLSWFQFSVYTSTDTKKLGSRGGAQDMWVIIPECLIMQKNVGLWLTYCITSGLSCCKNVFLTHLCWRTCFHTCMPKHIRLSCTHSCHFLEGSRMSHKSLVLEEKFGYNISFFVLEGKSGYHISVELYCAWREFKMSY